MEDLLFLAHRIPYPPDKGDKIRSWNMLRNLARSYRIHLGAFVDDPRDLRYQDKLESICESINLLPLSATAARFRSLGGLARNIPLSIPYYYDRRMQDWVNTRLDQDSLQRIFVYSSPVAQYVMNRRASACRRVIDFVDVDSDKWRQYALHKHWPLNWLYRREAERLLDFESSVASVFDASIFVSSAEAELFKQLDPTAAERVSFLDNGVDRDYFSPDRQYDNPYAARAKVIVFTGVMDYWANVHAVKWFALQVMPRIREAMPSATFFIVGARPSSEVQRLANEPGVEVTGAVRDVRPYLAHAHAAAAPLLIARGVQNKVLEAMAMAKPVLATKAAVEGIEFNGPEMLLVADDEQQMAAHAVRMLQPDTPVYAGIARQWVCRRYDWDSNLMQLNQLLEEPLNREAGAKVHSKDKTAAGMA
jgi:sugar transferase (PEP-CTERM/EpsH1 system associated)